LDRAHVQPRPRVTRIALIGEYDPGFPPHQATIAACTHSASALQVHVAPAWVSTADLSVDALRGFSALWILPGSPYRSLANTLAVIRHARERGIPCIGTCGGFQHMILEYARNGLGIRDAQHAEYDPSASDLFITQLECSLVGRELLISLEPGSRVARIYGALQAREQYYCNFGVNPGKVAELQGGELRVTGSDAEGEVRVVELPSHPFFIGTLFVPQLRSTLERPHPLINAFIRAASPVNS
jgi:CTP synthase (UTP-ammonia lyase)